MPMNRAVRSTTTVLVLSLIAHSTSGCSFIFSRPPPSQQAMRDVTDCSASRWQPGVDVAGAVTAGGLSVLALGLAGLEHNHANDEVAPSWNPRSTTNADVAGLVRFGPISAAIGLALGTSTIYGIRSADACDQARVRFIRDTSVYPPQYLPPPPPAAAGR